MSVVIRNAGIDDIEAILNIYAPYIKDTVVTFEYDIPSIEEFTERFLQITKKDPWIVCEIDNEIAGYAYNAPLFERTAFSWDTEFSVYINSKYHSMNIGSTLYKCLLDISSLQGYYNIYSLIESSNTASLNLHYKLGFKEITSMENIGFKHDGWRSLTWMLLSLHEYDRPLNFPISYNQLDVCTVNDIFKKYAKLINR